MHPVITLPHTKFLPGKLRLTKICLSFGTAAFGSSLQWRSHLLFRMRNGCFWRRLIRNSTSISKSGRWSAYLSRWTIASSYRGCKVDRTEEKKNHRNMQGSHETLPSWPQRNVRCKMRYATTINRTNSFVRSHRLRSHRCYSGYAHSGRGSRVLYTISQALYQFCTFPSRANTHKPSASDFALALFLYSKEDRRCRSEIDFGSANAPR